MYSGISDTITSWKQDRLLDNMHFQPSSFTNWLGASGPVTQQLETFNVCDLAGFAVRMKPTCQTSGYWVENAPVGEGLVAPGAATISSSPDGHH